MNKEIAQNMKSDVLIEIEIPVNESEKFYAFTLEFPFEYVIVNDTKIFSYIYRTIRVSFPSNETETLYKFLETKLPLRWCILSESEE